MTEAIKTKEEIMAEAVINNAPADMKDAVKEMIDSGKIIFM